MTDDLEGEFTVDVLNHFTRLTGRLGCSPADYGQAMAWESTGMPVAIVLRTLETWADKNKTKPWLRRAPLEWVNPWVEEAFHNWRRAIGPYYGRRVS